MMIQVAVVANGSRAGAPICWTDETSSSRYGIGTITDGDQDYGPRDIIPGTDFSGSPGRTAGKIVRDAVVMDWSCAESNFRKPSLTDEEVEILRRFCSQWPDGPQVQDRVDANHRC